MIEKMKRKEKIPPKATLYHKQGTNIWHTQPVVSIATSKSSVAILKAPNNNKRASASNNL
jgi:hypothetical protein